MDIEKIAEFTAHFVEFHLAAPRCDRALIVQIAAARVDDFFGEAGPTLLQRLDLLEPRDLQRVVGDLLLQGFELRLEFWAAVFIRREETLVTGDQEAAHRRFTIDREPQHFVGVADHALGVLGPTHCRHEISDQADEQRHRDEADAQRQRDIAAKDAAETELIDGLRCGHFFCKRHGESGRCGIFCGVCARC
ncbi:hypothetical protein QFZ96_008001 [Paraburkholderia youngii]